MFRNASSLRLAPLLQLGGGTVIFAYLAISDGLRIFYVYSGSAIAQIAFGVLAFLLTTGVAVAVAFAWAKMSMPARRIAFCLAAVWFLFMFWAFVSTHRVRGMRLFYEAVGEPDSPWSIAVITYQACVWTIAFAALPVGALMWRRAGP
jgi:hypothetical protein